ncbi:MAG: hypothetical protein Q9217_001900 [Psora testacea]
MADRYQDFVRLADVGENNYLGRPGLYALFLHFQGPRTILLQTRASRISDVLTARDVSEFADTQPGVVQPSATLDRYRERADPTNPQTHQTAASANTKAPQLQTANVGSDGKVTFEPMGGFKNE